MQSFFQLLKAHSAGDADFARVRAELERLLEQSPASVSQAASALQACYRGGALPEDQFLQLRALLKPYMDPSPNRQSAPMTQLRPQAVATMRRARPTTPAPAAIAQGLNPTTASNAQSRLPAQSSGTVSDTGRRWEDPHTWTVADDEPLYEGRILGRHYQLERQLGQGGMGVVWLAKDLVEADFSETPYLAIKVLNPEFKSHPDALKALHEEVRRSKLLSHPNIVSVYTFDRDAGLVFMTMEFLDGKSLSHIIENEFARGMPFDRAWPIIEGTGRALAYAHDRGTIHSDFKPSNVFVMAGGRAKVLDFGIARAMRRGRAFDAGSLGALTVEYASCEMLEDEQPDLRDDVYAYGCVAYELLSGRHVFGGKSATQARDENLKVVPLKGLGRAQNRALADALAFDRAKRTSSIEGVIEGLQRRETNYGLLSAAALFLVLTFAAAAWWGWNKVHGISEDSAFVNSLLKPNAEANPAVNPDQIKDEMDLGDDYLAQARTHFDAGVLSEGVSTAYGAYRAVLKLDPANRPAADKILEIVKLYQAQAESLRDEGQYKRAATLVGYALKIAPDRRSLLQLKAQLDPMAAASGDTSQ